MLVEILVSMNSAIVQRCRVIPYGAASVGQALGLMVKQNRFPRPSRVFLDGDQAQAPGCVNLPGDDAPERVVFGSLKVVNWDGISQRVGRDFSFVADACERAMLRSNHHEWLEEAATKLVLRTDILWQAMCAQWATHQLTQLEAKATVQTVEDSLIGLGLEKVQIIATPVPAPLPTEVGPPVFGSLPVVTQNVSKSKSSSNETLPLFEQSNSGGEK